MGPELMHCTKVFVVFFGIYMIGGAAMGISHEILKGWLRGRGLWPRRRALRGLIFFIHLLVSPVSAIVLLGVMMYGGYRYLLELMLDD